MCVDAGARGEYHMASYELLEGNSLGEAHSAVRWTHDSGHGDNRHKAGWMFCRLRILESDGSIWV